MHEQFVIWFYSLDDWISVFFYNAWPYAAVIFFGVIFLIIAFWLFLFVWAVVQLAFHSIWKRIKPVIDLFNKPLDQEGGAA